MVKYYVSKYCLKKNSVLQEKITNKLDSKGIRWRINPYHDITYLFQKCLIVYSEDDTLPYKYIKIISDKKSDLIKAASKLEIKLKSIKDIVHKQKPVTSYTLKDLDN